MSTKRLTSRQNRTIKHFIKVIERPEKYAPHGDMLEGEIVVEGPRPLGMALERGAKVRSVLVTEDFLKDDRHKEIVEALLQKEVSVNVVDRALMKEVSDTKTPQGIIALCRVRAYSLLDIKKPGFIVVSDGVHDPGNMGTMLRVSDAAGVRYFIALKGSVSPYNPKAVRSSAGSLFNINTVLSKREDFIKWCEEQGIPIVITDADAKESIYEFPPTGREVFVFGNETTGVSREIRSHASKVLKIPIYGKAESLNVATSAAILIYEMVRKIKSNLSR